MPSLFRRYPFLVATTAASGGVMLGAYLAFQIFAAPVEQRGPVGPPQSVAQAKASDTKAPDIAAETTGSAPAKEDVAAVDRCAGQTWPNLTHECMGQMRSRKPRRTVSTDRVGKPAPQAPLIASAPSNNTAAAGVPAAVPQTAVPNDLPAAADAKPTKDFAKPEKRKVKEARHKAKKPKREEADDRTLAFAPNNDRDDAWGDRVSNRGDRRMIVIRRERDGFGGGAFENLFGN